jgi:hypothetical protein
MVPYNWRTILKKSVIAITGPLNGYEEYLFRNNRHQGVQAVVAIITGHRTAIAMSKAYLSSQNCSVEVGNV